MFRKIPVLLALAALLLPATPAFAAEVPIAEQVAKLKPGQRIKVELVTGEVLKGKLDTSAPQQFKVIPSATPATPREVQFSEVRTIKPDGLSNGVKWVIAGGTAMLVVGLAARM